MIVCHRHRFIFLKTRKTGGSSMEIALSGLCGPDDVITPLSRREERVRTGLGYAGRRNYHLPWRSYDGVDVLRLLVRRRRKQFYNHVPAARVREWLGREAWDSYFKFAFERNPWDKTVSDYYWSGGREAHPTVEDFLRAEREASRSDFDIYAIHGVVAVDRLYRYEEMEGSIADLCARLGLDAPLRLPEYRAKAETRPPGLHYRDVLGGREAEIVAVKFAREIRLLGYEY